MNFAFLSGMDVLEVIRAEHERITDLFNQIKEERGKQQRKLLFNNIRYFLDLHLHALEHVFLPALKNYEECQVGLRQVSEDSSDLRKKLSAIEKLDIFSVEFENRIIELKNHFESHVSREEEDLFPPVRQVLRRPERERLGRVFQAIEHEREEAA